MEGSQAQPLCQLHQVGATRSHQALYSGHLFVGPKRGRGFVWEGGRPN